ncbi:tetrathionate reductase sensory transduction histidine kinase [Vibrio ishigakensis]|uniref:histidine kinase n=1 Tax=Vibrio ishigakensis TaxID=1481914 RepID=A0A0B8P3I8_9VIBR|nr:sensor histidine kinase [Vibrio ishigakensis]GAM57539.1 tetrathionate reductase sensory transduction histidine kinase [Vibrio ishigakensis]
MKKVRIFQTILLVLLSLMSMFSQAQTSSVTQSGQTLEQKTQVDVGVLAIRGHLYAKSRWQPTIDWLNQIIPEAHFVLHLLDLDGMSEAVKNQNMSFVLTNPGQAVRLGRQYSLSWIATLSNRNGQNINASIGSALVVRADSSYQSLQDVSGHPMAAVSERAFGGYLTLRYEAIQQGIDPNTFYAEANFLGFPVDANLYQLRDGYVDAAVVPACLLEQMGREGLLDVDKFRVLNAESSAEESCQVSTTLYPNWSLAKTGKGSDELAKKMSQSLLSMKSDNPAAIAAKASGWAPPVSLLSIDKLYQAMDLHPLQQPWWQEGLRWLRTHQEWGWALFLFVIFLNIYHFWLEYRFSKSKRELELTLQRLKAKSEMLEHSQRLMIVSELGSSIAHEINQPLAAIRNYSEGGLLRLQKERPHQDIIPVMTKIQAQVERADAIVQRLRNLIKKRSVEMSETDLEQLISDTVELLDFRLQKQSIDLIRGQQGTARFIEVDPVGIQQVLVNVINNAIDACVARADEDDYQAEIVLYTNYQQGQVEIEIRDNGTGLTHDKPTEAFVSTKSDGLGLGLSICRDVMEIHHGEFIIKSVEPKGCMVTLSLPFTADE